MTNSNTSKFKRVLCGLLSALTMLSGTAAAGTAVTASAAEIDTEASSISGGNDEAVFSWDNASVYFLLTDRFYNGDTSNDHSYGRGLTQSGSVANFDNYGAFQGGDFAGVTQKINEGYFDDLGVNAIWLSAPYEQIHGYCIGSDGDSFAHYSYHGYYVLDYTESDKNFGTKEEFKTLVDTAHEHGIRIVMDIVMNHAGYNTIQDMAEYDFGSLKSGWESYYYGYSNINNTDYHGYIDYDASASVWSKWWGPDWIRCGLPGYTTGSGDIEGSLAGLPDFKTGSSSNVGLPAVLQTKWQKEGTYAAKSAKYGSDTVTGYISTWLAEWVREYGVDGFRCDTAKHVELSSWKTLKTKCVAALKEWKAENPDKKLDDLDFWMTGECFGHKAEKSQYYTQGGFDSMINFEFAPAVNSSNIPSAGSVDSVYSRYANSINNDSEFNVLTYLASHDTTLIQGDRNYAGSFLLMCPGGIQIYYGDETNRPLINSKFAQVDPGAGHQYRSFMNWSSMDTAVLNHWQKVGQFRNNHIAVGAGSHKTISAYDSTNGYTFARIYDKDGIQDTIVATLFAQANKDITIDVSSVWSDGIEITNFYDGTTCKVSGGKVTFNSGANGTILMQEPQGAKGKVIVTHINQDTGETIKTETIQGLIGEAYTANPLSTEGYTVSRTVGSKTGTYSETDANVTFYYTFDSKNYAYIVIKYVDASTGAEIADSDTEVGKIGSAYTTSAKSIKNYEVDESLTSNSAGTVKSGTTTVTYKYNYVEPSNLQVHYYNSNSWSTVFLYAYTGSGATATQLVGAWPGSAMTAESSGWFFAEVPDAESASIMFNNNAGAQEPGQQQPGYDATGEVWVKSGKVYPTGKVNVKYVSTDGKVLGTEVLKGMADGTEKYTTTAKTFSGYTLSSTPSNAAGTFSESTVSVTYTYTPDTPVNTLKNNSKVSSTSVEAGTTVTLTGSASGGTSPYKYAYYYKRTTQTNWTTIGTEFGTATSASFKPSSKGDFELKVIVKDSTGAAVTKTFNLTVSETVAALTNSSKISAASVPAGTTVTLTGAASGGTGSYKYAYYYKRTTQTNWTTLGTEFGTATTASVKPSSAGTMNLKVIVKDSAGTTATKTFTLTITEPVAALTNNSKISAASVPAGTTVTLTGAASGGTSPYKYAYYYKRTTQTNWTTLGTEFGTATTASVKPSSAGTMSLKVVVKDGKGTTATKTFTLTITNPLTNSSKISAASVPAGTTVTLTGAASGGKSSYKYAYYYKRNTATNWTVIGTEFGTATTASVKPSSAGTLNIKVVVKDSNGTTATKTFTLTVTNPLTNSSKLSAASVPVGTKITITGAASGGTGTYKYAYYYKRNTATNWTVLGTEFGTATSASVKPSSAGSLDIKVVVKDSAGTTAAKTFNVTCTQPTLVNSAKVSTTNLALGNKLTITGAASGGTGTYKYAYYYKRTTQTNWTTLGTEFGTATTATLKPSSEGTFEIKVVVKDGSNTTSTKTFKVTCAKVTLVNNSTVSTTSLSLGSTLTIKGAASGGTGSYKYAYYYKKSTSNSWSVIGTEYGTATSASLKPSSTGTYDIKIVVQDTSGETVTKTYAVTVK